MLSEAPLSAPILSETLSLCLARALWCNVHNEPAAVAVGHDQSPVSYMHMHVHTDLLYLLPVASCTTLGTCAEQSVTPRVSKRKALLLPTAVVRTASIVGAIDFPLSALPHHTTVAPPTFVGADAIVTLADVCSPE